MTRLYLIRHGDAYDAEGIQLEHYPLNNQGKIQALQLAKRFKNNHFDNMYCSKIQRAIETCQIVNEDHGMDVIYTSALNEVGNEAWPKPGLPTEPDGVRDLHEQGAKIYESFRRLVKRHKNQEIILFTHGNWIRTLLSKILSNCDPQVFARFIIHNTSITIIDVDESGFEHIVSVSDAAHTHLYDTHI